MKLTHTATCHFNPATVEAVPIRKVGVAVLLRKLLIRRLSPSGALTLKIATPGSVKILSNDRW
jgi:hypothetical protein